MANPLTRRTALFGVLALPAAAVPAVALADDMAKWAADPETKPVFVRVGSPSMSVSPQIAAAIRDWRQAVAVKDEASVDYNALIARTRFIRDDDPIRNRWIDAEWDATQAQHKLLTLLLSEVGA